mgnify:CR=1 FL=1
MNEEATGAERRQCDVLVIGGGPAGSTVAPLLVEKGYRVTLLEKAYHPRFHIGESLLPANLPLFERLGVAAEVKAIGMEKWGADFVSPHHDAPQTFLFAEAWNKSMPYAYQVKRAEFDAILIDNAARKGVEVCQGCKAKSVDFLPDQRVLVRARQGDGRDCEWLARFSPIASRSSTAIRTTTVQRFMGILQVPRATPGRRKGTSRSSGSNTAGSGSSRCRAASPVSAWSPGRTS